MGMQKKVLVAMSGGVDSTMASKVLMDQGYETEGIFFRMTGLDKEDKAVKKAEKVAAMLDIKLHVKDKRDEFHERVVKYFLGEYQCGRTPNPCVMCNPRMKFKELLSEAEKLGIGKVATGHYARTQDTSLLRAKAKEQDQSYFLYRLNDGVLSKTIFPLGEFESKKEVYKIAKKLGMSEMYDETESSQDVCFIKEKTLSEFLKKQIPSSAFREGNIVNLTGEVLGKHEGLITYTIGQRKGLKIGGTGPYFVCGMDFDKNELIVGKEDDLYAKGCVISDLVFSEKTKKKVEAQIRFRSKSVIGELVLKDDLGEFRFEKEKKSVTPGQSIVFYDGDKVLGGGIIEKALK